MMELNPRIREILYNRGIKTEEDISEYLSDKPQKTYDPFLLLNMEAGVDLILSAIDNGDTICIYGDYDADGVTSVSLIRDVLRELGANTTYYIPSRFDDGYGLNTVALDKIKASGADLVVTVDCGSTSIDEVAHAKTIGLEMLVTDHHAVGENLPDCPVINPNNPACQYPFKSLAGVGVAFKLAQALVESLGAPKQILTRNLDLVAIGTVADVVPLIDENRTLVKYGLRAINLGERLGLKALIEEARLEGSITSQMISFVIGPHINSAGRVDNATLAAKLLQTKDETQARELARELTECNAKRRAMQDDTYELSKIMLAEENDENRENLDRFILLELPKAHEGIIGIVAGKIKEEYNVPTLLVTDIGGGECKGTGRSINTINLYDILAKSRDLFTKFGGHSAACGFTIPKENLQDLRQALVKETEVLYHNNPEIYSPVEEADIVLEGTDVNLDFVTQQALMEPFGKDNEKPSVAIDVSAPEGSWSRMGKDNQFLRLKGQMNNGQNISCTDFKAADKTEKTLQMAVRQGNKIRLFGNLEENVWNGARTVRLNIKSTAPAPVK